MSIIKIQTQKPEIPVEIGDLHFTFDVSDESIKEFRKQADIIRKELENIAISEDEEEALEQAKGALNKGFDIMLGSGAFEKIYNLSPSITICMRYFIQLAEGIEIELRKMGMSENQKELAKKYLAKK